MRFWLAALGVFLITNITVAQQFDTLRTYSARGGYVYYTDPAITMQAARFEVGGRTQIHQIHLMLGGSNAAGSARLHIYGNEGGLPAPGLEKDLVPPVTVRKTRAGSERVSVNFATPPSISSNQFFVVVDHLDPDVVLLSDKRRQPASCASHDEVFYSQAIRTRNDGWMWGPYGFHVDVITTRVNENSAAGRFSDETVKLGLPDSIAQHRSIAWADIDRDSYLDLLVDGRLYRNNNGASFTDITASAGLSDHPRAGFFIDTDHDDHIDLLFVGVGSGESNGKSRLYVNDGKGMFSPVDLNLPDITDPTCISIADANSDGYLDVFVGQGKTVTGNGVRNQLYVNNYRYGFEVSSPALYADTAGYVTGAGSQWGDFDSDGDLDLFVAGENASHDRLWLRSEDGSFRAATRSEFFVPDTVSARSGCHWADYDNDGDMDLLLPMRFSAHSVHAGRVAVQSMIYEADGRPYRDAVVEGEGYEERQGGGTWGDIDNDGRTDVLLTSSCDCRYARLFLRDERDGFAQKTLEYGLGRVAAGPDAVLVDFNNDGWLDIATFLGGRFVLLKATPSATNASVAIEPEGLHAVGATVQVFADGRRYTQQVASGRGLLMQEPLRLHFGLGDTRRVDSVQIRWAHGRSETFTTIEVNRLNRLREGGAGSAVEYGVRDLAVAPNPFSSELHLRYTIPVAQQITITIHTLDGRLLHELVNEKQPAGRHDVVWQARDEEGARLPQGTYLYRIVTPAGEQSGKVVLIR